MTEEERLNIMVAPLYNMFEKLSDDMAAIALDELDICDDDLRATADLFRGSPMGDAFATLLEHVTDIRIARRFRHMAAAVFAAGRKEGLPCEDVYDEYNKLNPGKA